jgi:hypothetical protein
VKTAEEICREFGIRLPSFAAGRYYTICPKCSASRSRAHQKSECLGITINAKGVHFGCSHCGWKGGGYYNGSGGERTNALNCYYSYGARLRKVRGRNKQFWWEHLDGGGGWTKGTGGADTKILYRLDEVRRAVADGRTIAVVEGEKDADNLWHIGIPATCNAHGAHDPTKKQKPKWCCEHSEQLRGAPIVVFNDSDEAGYEHAEATCKLSHGVAKRVRRLDLKEHWPEIPKGGDVSDWLAAGGTREQLDALIEQAPDWQPRHEPTTDPDIADAGAVDGAFREFNASISAAKSKDDKLAAIRRCAKAIVLYVDNDDRLVARLYDAIPDDVDFDDADEEIAIGFGIDPDDVIEPNGHAGTAEKRKRHKKTGNQQRKTKPRTNGHGDTDNTGGPREQLDTLVEQAPDWPDLDKRHSPRDDTQRAVIRVEPGMLHERATAGELALIAAGVPFYAHAEEIKRPVVDEVEATKGRKAKVARFASVTTDAMRDWLSRIARWERFNERKKDYTPTDPPRDVAATILSRSGEWQFLRAVGVITTPTLRPDGTILSIPGYDPVTRMVLTNPPVMPAIPEEPTRDMAIAALQLLNNLLEEFPFTDEPGRAVALSELITPVVRGALTCAPLHANRAPTPGSGKSFLLDIVSAIVSGQPCPVISAGADEFETEKRLGAALLRGQALIAIDNLNGELRGDALCQMIERPIVDVRPLGVSRLVRIESRATLLATGNNLILVGDVVRRVLLCSLDPELERPELRRFRANPFEAVLADRGRYIAAALTIVRAYITAGCPNALPALASFEDWSRLVRSALVWLDCADPVDTMEAARAEDPELEALRRVIAAWLEAIGPSIPQTAGQLRDHAEMKKSDFDYNGAGTFAHPEFRDALLSIAYGGGSINAKALGRWLSRYRGRVINGHKITSREDTHRKQVVWTLMRGTEGVCG